ncbi:uncharacterized protein LOC111637694 [Centruroides sculpturatus]|uniref:uncharacterized protein LOC111637694 n=1 Tax=Centruroides sculpturatus TaxID=218467 RepID=UPI000C6D4D21|nr:uncharacterized protein LOC111637694 [Centruroides sculpturatus]
MSNDNNGSMATYVPEIARVVVRAPLFWKANPTLWFAQIEAQFANANITADETKFNHVIAAMESEILAQVSDIVVQPPNKEKYLTLKRRLIDQFADSEQQRLRLLLQGIELGDQRPSQLLRKMRELATNRISDDMLKTLWLQRLPTAAQQILAVSGEDLTKVAKLADKICEVTTPMGQIQAVSPLPAENHVDAIAQLKEQISQLSLQIQQITESKPYQRSRHRSCRFSSPHRNRSTSEGRKVCWYHRKFGDKANKCTSPCQFQSGN